jgi:tetratricopeptide (TPR) repeat protein
MGAAVRRRSRFPTDSRRSRCRPMAVLSRTRRAPHGGFAQRLRPRPSLVIGVAVLIVGVTYGIGRIIPAPATTGLNAAPSQPTVATPDGPTGTADNSLARIDQAIGVWSANLGRDKADFISATNLADLYYSRARLTGNVDDYTRATEAITASLAAYPASLAAQQLRAQLLFATHDFSGALAAARAILAKDPAQVAALATTADAELELGDYVAASSAMRRLARTVPGPAVTARLAHLAALRGDTAAAARLADRAITELNAAGGSPTDRSWYEYLAGYLAFQFGDLAGAERQFRAAVGDWPHSYLALAGLARTRAAQGATAEAITLYQRAIDIVPQPEFLAALGDLYAVRGRTSDAQAQYDLVRAIARLASVQAQVYNRQLVLFDANHSEQAAEALRLAERELSVRKDVYGWDAYAWALYANRRYAAAAVAMRNARALGTVDPLLDYHQGMIASALGEAGRARTLLSAALARNAGFDPLQASRARAELAGLYGAGS